MTPPASTPLLEVGNLSVRFHTPTRIVEAVRGLSFTLGREKLAIVGEDFAPVAEWIGLVAVVAILYASYSWTRRKALTA